MVAEKQRMNTQNAWSNVIATVSWMGFLGTVAITLFHGNLSNMV